MNKKNFLLAKSDQMNLCGVIGMGLALIGLLLPSLKVSYMGMGMSGTMFEATMWTILPLILIVGACALYVLKYDVAGFLAAVLAAVVFFLIMCIEKAVGKSQVGGYGVGVHFTWGFWIAFLGFMIAIAAPWINKLIFKPQMKQTRQQIDPNMIQGGPGMNQANPYMQQPGQFANQTMNQANPYM